MMPKMDPPAINRQVPITPNTIETEKTQRRTFPVRIKLATMGTLMAVISLIFTATLISEGSGMMFRGLFAGRAAESACFDLYIGVAGDEPLSQ